MAICFPTSEDTTILVSFVRESNQRLSAHHHHHTNSLSSPPQRHRERYGDEDEDIAPPASSVPPPPPLTQRSSTTTSNNSHAKIPTTTTSAPQQQQQPAGGEHVDDDDETTIVLRSACASVLQLIATCSKMFAQADGPVVSPPRFLNHNLAAFVQAHEEANTLHKTLWGEGREHGLHVAPEAIKASYYRFIDATRAVQRWTGVGLRVTEGRGDRDGRPMAENEVVQDVTAIYNAYFENGQLFFVSECTLFDPRIQRRVLMPGYYAALRDHVRSLRGEVERLRAIDDILQRAPATSSTTTATTNNPNLHFPSSAPILSTEDATTTTRVSSSSTSSKPSTARFYPPIQDFVWLMESLEFYLASCIVEDELTTVTYYRILYDSVKKETQVIAARLAQIPQAAPITSNNPPSTVMGENLNAVYENERNSAFATFDEVRGRVLELQSSIRRDIEAKNRTHKTLHHHSEPGSPASSPARAQQRPAQAAPEPTGWWANMKNVSSKLFWGAADVVTCKAELFGGEVDAYGQPLSVASPLAGSKQQILNNVDLLAAAVESIAESLETQFPGVYHRDWLARLQKAATRVVTRLESMTVVFAPGS